MNNLKLNPNIPSTPIAQIQDVPADLLKVVFSFLNIQELSNARTVCRFWNTHAIEPLCTKYYQAIIQMNSLTFDARRAFSNYVARLTTHDPVRALTALNTIQNTPANQSGVIVGLGLHTASKVIASTQYKDAGSKAMLCRTLLDTLIHNPQLSRPSRQAQMIPAFEAYALERLFSLPKGALTRDAIGAAVSLVVTIPAAKLTADGDLMRDEALIHIARELISSPRWIQNGDTWESSFDAGIEILQQVSATSNQIRNFLSIQCSELVKQGATEQALTLATQVLDAGNPAHAQQLSRIYLAISSALITMGKSDEAIELLKTSPATYAQMELIDAAILTLNAGVRSVARQLTSMITPEMQADPQAAAWHRTLTELLNNPQPQDPELIQALVNEQIPDFGFIQIVSTMQRPKKSVF